MQQQEERILDYLQSHEAEIFEDLLELVGADSPTNDKGAMDRCTQVLRGVVKNRLGLEPKVYPQQQQGDHLLFTQGNQPQQILVVGHYDTVWDVGQLPIRREGDKLYGPGVLDMKGGLVMAIWAMKAIRELNLPVEKRIALFCNSDEETGSKTSARYIVENALESVAALICEPAEAVTGKLKIARKGASGYQITIHGKAVHAGNDHKNGISAVEEMARQITYLHSLTDYEKGTTLNVGVAKGGSKRNVVADLAQMEVDLRYSTAQEAHRIDDIIQNLKPSVPGATLEVEGGLGSMPLESTPANLALFEKAIQAGKALDMVVEGASVGGGSDGNKTSAAGVPTLDGLGATGEGLHANNEHIVVSEYLPRIALFTALLTRI